MNHSYEKPIINIIPESAEGVYLASGSTPDNASNITAKIVATPANSYDPYNVAVHHPNTNNENPAKFSIKFNQAISNAWGANGNINGFGTDTLSFEVWNNGPINFTLSVITGPGLQIINTQ